MREAVGADYLVALRLGASDYTESGATIDDAVYACKSLRKPVLTCSIFPAASAALR